MRNARHPGRSASRTGGAFVPVLAALLLFVLVPRPATATGPGDPDGDPADLMSLYDPGIPRSVSREWSFPTGFSLGIEAGHRLLVGEDLDATLGDRPKVDVFPLAFLMKYSLYTTRRISQTVGVGLGPYLIHQGTVPIQLSDLELTGASTWVTEWVSEVSQDLYLNLKMNYTHVFQSVAHQVHLEDFSTWLGLRFQW